MDITLTESQKSLEFLRWLNCVGRMAFDLLGNYTPTRERQIHASLATDLRFRGGVALSYRCFLLGVGFLVVLFGGGFVLSYRRFALGFRLGRSNFAADPSYPFVGAPEVLVFWTLS